MVFARRSALRAFTAAQAFRTAPVARGSARMLGRRFASTGKGYEEHKTSDLPWLLGSVGLGGPAIVYLLQSGPEKKPHGDSHDHDDDAENKESHEEEPAPEAEEAPQPTEEKPADDVEQQPKEDEKDEKAEQPAEKSENSKDEDTQKPDTAEEPKDESSDKPQHDEPAAAKAPGGPESTSFKQDKLSNADTNHPHMNDPGKSEKGEGEPETAKLKGTVSPERPQK